MSAATEAFSCAPWCTENDHHHGYVLRGDQSCWGPQRKTIFSLDEHAPAIGIDKIPSDAAGITVYSYQGWYELPKVRLNVFWEANEVHDERPSIDHDFLLTPSEAIELAHNLIAGVEDILGRVR